jgi:hypothetical protein
MKISKEVLKILSRKLPSGSASKIQQTLADKGDPYSLGYIYRVLNPEYKNYNSDIITEAVKIAEKSQVIDPKDLEDQISKLDQS